MTLKTSAVPILAACLFFSFYSRSSDAATMTNLLTICTSAKAVTQASRCTAWQYNVYSPSAYIESYPQVSPGPTGYTDPAYAYHLGSTITPTMGVKVCPTALTPGTSYTSPAADPCPNNKLVAASSVISESRVMIAMGQGVISAFAVTNSQVTPLPGSPYTVPDQYGAGDGLR